jgi:hypothetical protein
MAVAKGEEWQVLEGEGYSGYDNFSHKRIAFPLWCLLRMSMSPASRKKKESSC